MVLRLRHCSIVFYTFLFLVAFANAQEVIVPEAIDREAKRWLSAAMAPLCGSTYDASRARQYTRPGLTDRSVGLFYDIGMVSYDKTTLRVKSVGLGTSFNSLEKGPNTLTPEDVIARCQGFVSKVFDQVPALKWSYVRPKLDESEGTWYLFPRCEVNGIPFRQCGIMFEVNGADGKIKSARLEGIVPAPPVEQNNSPVISADRAKRIAGEALLSSGCAFDVNILREPNLNYDIPPFGPFPSQYSERHMSLRRTMTAMKVYIMTVMDGESWNARTNKYDDQLMVFVDAITGEPMCVTYRFSLFRFGSIKKAMKPDASVDILKMPFSIQRGNEVRAVPENSVTVVPISELIQSNGFVWLNSGTELSKLYYDSTLTTVWIEQVGKRVGGKVSEKLREMIRTIMSGPLQIFGMADVQMAKFIGGIARRH